MTYTKFLIDECLTVELVGECEAAEFFAQHVGQSVKLRSKADWDLIKIIQQEDYILVTNNARDFIKLYQHLNIHNGLVIIMPSVTEEHQIELFNLVLNKIGPSPDLVNKMVKVTLLGEVNIEDWPR
jgi:predicted nuclease of predicted toxin-antitoxin system